MTVEENPEYISNIVFGRSKSHQFAAEIAIGSTLAFLIGQSPTSGIRGAVLTWVMAILIVTPVLRFLVYTGRFTPVERVLSITVRPVELSATLGLVHLFHFVAESIPSTYSTLSVVELTTAVTITATLLYIVLFELLFKTYRFSWGTLFFLKTVTLKQQFEVPLDDPDALFDAIWAEGSHSDRLKAVFRLLVSALLMVAWGQTAYYLLQNSIPERADEHFDELRAFVADNREQGKAGTKRGVLFAFSIATVVVLPVFGIIAWLLSLAFASFGTMILVLVIMRLARHIVGFTYIAFGALRYDQFITTNKRTVALTGLYTCAVYLLLFYPP